MPSVSLLRANTIELNLVCLVHLQSYSLSSKDSGSMNRGPPQRKQQEQLNQLED